MNAYLFPVNQPADSNGYGQVEEHGGHEEEDEADLVHARQQEVLLYCCGLI